MTARVAGVVLAAGAGSVLLVAAVLMLWLAVIAGAGANTGGSLACAPSLGDGVPAELQPIFASAANEYELGPDGASILAGLTSIESGFGQNIGPSSAGAIGWTQFLPSTWARYGVDADGDGRRDPYDAQDAIHSAANYLRASGAPRDWRRALFAYNHAGWYVDKVLAEARRLEGAGTAESTCTLGTGVAVGDGASRIRGGGEIVPIPGLAGESVDERILRDVAWMIVTFRVIVTDGYAHAGHDAEGEHPLGLAVDLVPGPGGTWDDVDRLARWAEPEQGRPRPPFRWVGYDGDKNHGRGQHLHLSWNHAPAPSRRPPAAWVDVIGRS